MRIPNRPGAGDPGLDLWCCHWGDGGFCLANRTSICKDLALYWCCSMYDPGGWLGRRLATWLGRHVLLAQHQGQQAKPLWQRVPFPDTLWPTPVRVSWCSSWWYGNSPVPRWRSGESLMVRKQWPVSSCHSRAASAAPSVPASTLSSCRLAH